MHLFRTDWEVEVDPEKVVIALIAWKFIVKIIYSGVIIIIFVAKKWNEMKKNNV